jgi:hypothetical protein
MDTAELAKWRDDLRARLLEKGLSDDDFHRLRYLDMILPPARQPARRDRIAILDEVSAAVVELGRLILLRRY